MFILWDYKIGKQLLCTNFRNKISKDDIEKFNKHLHNYNLEESVEVLPVKHLKLVALDTTSSLAILSFYNNSLLLVYIINSISKSDFEVMYVQSIIADSEPIECYLYKNNLWILNELGFKIYEFKDNNFTLTDKTIYKINELNNYWKTLKKDITQQDLFSILYKRKYDNVQEYLQRKKTRLANSIDI
ncbi:hypothetical protein QLX08_003933 [Tetragonisca angustula]